MTSPFRKLSATARACLFAGVALGAALIPVAAQTVSYSDGQVAVRSDGIVYLLSGGQKRQVATVQISDDEINAYPEGPPIFTALAPLGSSGTTASAPSSGSGSSSSGSSGSGSSGSSGSTSPTSGGSSSSGTSSGSGSSSSGSSGSGSSGSGSTSSAAPGATAVETPTGATGEADPNLPIEVDIDGKPSFQANERIILDIKTKAGANCQLAVKWPDGTEKDQDKKTADSRGRCHYSIEVPPSMTTGTGTLKGIVQDSANHTSRQNVDFDIITK